MEASELLANLQLDEFQFGAFDVADPPRGYGDHAGQCRVVTRRAGRDCPLVAGDRRRDLDHAAGDRRIIAG